MKSSKTLLMYAVAGALALLVQPVAKALDFVGPDMVEGGDAGSLPGSAKIASGSGPLNSIGGNLTGPFSGLAIGIDFEDMYLIDITDATNFSASTLAIDGGSAAFDTQLWLFSAASGNVGLGLLGNNDVEGGATGSVLGPISTDGTGVTLTNGLYYLAISASGNVPQASGSLNIFDFVPPGLEVSGPDGPGGMLPIAGWSASVGSGSYVIVLEGVSFVPTPGAAVILAFGLFVSSRRRRSN